jgi:hypothetical protein
MPDELDDEVRKLFQQMDAELSVSKILAGLEGEKDKTAVNVGNAIELMNTHFDIVKNEPRYQEVIRQLAAVDMLMTAGFQLITRLESDKLGRELTLRELFNLLVGLFSDLNHSERT